MADKVGWGVLAFCVGWWLWCLVEAAWKGRLAW